MLVSKRSFLTGLVGLLAAPPIVRASSLMKIKPISTSEFLIGDPHTQWSQDYFLEYVRNEGFKPYMGSNGLFILTGVPPNDEDLT